MKQPLRHWYTGMVQKSDNALLWKTCFRQLLSLEEALEKIQRLRDPELEAMLLERAHQEGWVIGTYWISTGGVMQRLGPEDK